MRFRILANIARCGEATVSHIVSVDKESNTLFHNFGIRGSQSRVGGGIDPSAAFIFERHNKKPHSPVGVSQPSQEVMLHVRCFFWLTFQGLQHFLVLGMLPDGATRIVVTIVRKRP
jgi:hypothetical protein